jgi:hypothetical protein
MTDNTPEGALIWVGELISLLKRMPSTVRITTFSVSTKKQYVREGYEHDFESVFTADEDFLIRVYENNKGV